MGKKRPREEVEAPPAPAGPVEENLFDRTAPPIRLRVRIDAKTALLVQARSSAALAALPTQIAAAWAAQRPAAPPLVVEAVFRLGATGTGRVAVAVPMRYDAQLRAAFSDGESLLALCEGHADPRVREPAMGGGRRRLTRGMGHIARVSLVLRLERVCTAGAGGLR